MTQKREVQKISTGYSPRHHQAMMHASLKRFKLGICHRRFGKTHFAINEKIDRGFRNTLRNPQYAYIAPNFGQAKRVAWEPLKDYLRKVPGFEANEAELRVDIARPQCDDKIRFMLLGAENPNSIRGIYLDGATFDEFDDMDPVVWTDVVRPALSDRQGWANFIGTFKGMKHLYRLLQIAKDHPQDWDWWIFKASETGILPQSELDAARAVMSEEAYLQEYECSPTASLIGSYYGKYLESARKEGRITKAPWDPVLGVKTYWDLGIGDTTCIWFLQQLGMQHRAIDYYEMSGMGLEHYAKILREKPYAYDEHVLPHDAGARDLSTGRSREETLRSHKIGRTRVLQKHAVEDGINAVRVLFSKIWFDEDKCKRGLDSLMNYEKQWDSKNQIFSDKPLHNWASNGADAFRTFAMGVKDDFGRKDPSEFQDTADNDYDLWSA